MVNSLSTISSATFDSPGNTVVIHPSYKQRLESLRQQASTMEAALAKEALKLEKFSIAVDSLDNAAQRLTLEANEKLAAAVTLLSQGLAKLKKLKGLSKADKAFVAEMARELTFVRKNLPSLEEMLFDDDFFNADDLNSEQSQQFTEEGDRGSRQGSTHADNPWSSEELSESREFTPADRDLRSLYLSLSKRFHPDLARTEEERVQFTKVMGQINQLNDTKDLAGLMDFAEQLEITITSVSGESIDFECERLEKIILLRKNDLKVLKKLYRELRKGVPSATEVDAVVKGKKTVDQIIKSELRPVEEAIESYSRANQLVTSCLAGEINFTTLEKLLEEEVSKLTESLHSPDEFLEMDIMQALMEEFLDDMIRQSQPKRSSRSTSKKKRGR